MDEHYGHFLKERSTKIKAVCNYICILEHALIPATTWLLNCVTSMLSMFSRFVNRGGGKIPSPCGFWPLDNYAKGPLIHIDIENASSSMFSFLLHLLFIPYMYIYMYTHTYTHTHIVFSVVALETQTLSSPWKNWLLK